MELFKQCENEPLAYIGAIQSHGFLVIVESATGRVRGVSENVFRFLGIPAKDMVNRPLEDFLGEAISSSVERNSLMLELVKAPATLHWKDYEEEAIPFHVLLTQRGEFFYLESAPLKTNDRKDVAPPDLGCPTVFELKQELVNRVKQLTGYDRVMYYQFLRDGSGLVQAEARTNDVQSYLHHYFPAHDIPQIARDLYLRNRLRYIVDVNDAPIPIVSDRSASFFDLSDVGLRAVSPIHIEYLKNMGVKSSLSVAICLDGKLDALLALHGTRQISVDWLARQILQEWVARFEQQLAVMLAKEQSAQVQQAQRQCRELSERLTGVDLSESRLSAIGNVLAKACHVTTVVIMPQEGQPLQRYGRELPEDWLEALTRWSQKLNDHEAFSENIHEDSAGLLPQNESAAGVALVRGTSVTLIGIRPEITIERLWGGDSRAHLPYEGARIEPRKSFETYVENLKCHGEPWSTFDKQLFREIVGLL